MRMSLLTLPSGALSGTSQGAETNVGVRVQNQATWSALVQAGGQSLYIRSSSHFTWSRLHKAKSTVHISWSKIKILMLW